MDEGEETNLAHVLGNPSECAPSLSLSWVSLEQTAAHRFDYQERILRLVGEGTGAEVRTDGGLGAVPAWKRQLRNEISGLRFKTLGY